MKKLIGRIPIKSFFVILSIVFQLLWFFAMLYRLNEYSRIFTLVMHAASVAVSVKIAGTYDNSSFRLAWIMVILLVPVFGIMMYFLFGSARAGRGVRRKYRSAVERTAIPDYDMTLPQSRYRGMMTCLLKEGFPVFEAGAVTFHEDGGKALEELITDIYNARNYIFMEYFIIDERSEIWERVEKALCDRADAGIRVRIIYDALGCLALFSDRRVRMLRGRGIDIRCFNPMTPWMAGLMNNRDHRKVAIIDGETVYTGGWNLADEYANITSPYGHWMDCGVKIRGSAVEGFVCMYSVMWNFITGQGENPAHYFSAPARKAGTGGGYIMVYGNAPFGEKNACRNVYLSLIRGAEKYLYFTTPYLVCDDEMIRAICLSAESGVDVRIVVPGIPDKRFVYAATVSYFHVLMRSGVRIYRYTPGFIHAKLVLSDGAAASVGTVNMDFRSLYLHFENGVVIYESPVISDIYDAFLMILSKSSEAERKEYMDRSPAVRFTESIFRIIAPML